MARFRMTVSLEMEIEVEAPSFEEAMVKNVVPFVGGLRVNPIPPTLPHSAKGPIQSIRIVVPEEVMIVTHALPDAPEPRLRVVPPPPDSSLN